ncbi:DUF3604 domain-containing protein [Cognatitamlana onchidii]|uniref:DUF3604 domain-containing protein n=1 Tax=Cognatitamlana onchidii TaxID=2562860 RepID=UPI0010A5B76B|nr:DUF3604 domain-containing protein [Algibacter onchidii]
MKPFQLICIVLVFSCLTLTNCKNEQKTITEESTVEQSDAYQESTIPYFENKEAFFGETHMHTSYSLDAYIGGNRLTPDQSLRFAQGEEMLLELTGKKVQLKRPLDFAAVTDHSEYIGEMQTVMNPNAKGYNSTEAKQLRNVKGLEEAEQLFLDLVVKSNRSATPQHPPFYQGVTTTMDAWSLMNEATEKNYKPGKFTTLHAFEWSGAPAGGNLHRNIIFRDTIVPDLPVSYIEVNRETELWAWLDQITKNGSTVLAIPHNSNASKGMMFDENMPDGMPLTKNYAEKRAQYERTIEIMQIKGASEVYPKFWPNDEFAQFENAESLKNYSGRLFEEKNFVRHGLKKGLEYQIKLGVNPYKLGFNGGTDNHNGEMSNVEEDNYSGSHGLTDGTAQDRVINEVPGWAKTYDINPGAITGVWANNNTREGIWDGLYNRETFATSGPRMKVRFFAGYGYKDSYESYDDLAKDGYDKGVPMGGDLTVSPNEKPKFLIWVLKDPMNANLDRVQVIKGWYKDGKLQEKTYNVAVSDNRLNADGSVTPTDAQVDLKTGAFDNSKGATQFSLTWSDPDFNADEISFYYVRALQLPTARWTLWDEIREGVVYPDHVAKTVQERVWSSPIWCTPTKSM